MSCSSVDRVMITPTLDGVPLKSRRKLFRSRSKKGVFVVPLDLYRDAIFVAIDFVGGRVPFVPVNDDAGAELLLPIRGRRAVHPTGSQWWFFDHREQEPPSDEGGSW